MPPKRVSKVPKSYGRQASGKTIKSLSMDVDLVQWAESQALEAGLSLSSWLNGTLRSRMSASPAPRSAKPAAKATKPAAPKPAPSKPASKPKATPAAKPQPQPKAKAQATVKAKVKAKSAPKKKKSKA